MAKYTLHSDGGSRGNPGPSGLGFTISNAADDEICYGAAYADIQTNNQAEYQALIWGLKNALALSDIDELEVIADSELMIKQLKGEYKVAKAELKTLYIEAQALLEQVSSYSLIHLKRNLNKRADELANIAMDTEEISGDYIVEPDLAPRQFFDFEYEAQKQGRAVIKNYELSVCETLQITKHLDHKMTWNVELCISKQTRGELSSKLIDIRSLSEILRSLMQDINGSIIKETEYFKTHAPTAENIAEYLYHKTQHDERLAEFKVKYICIHMSETSSFTYYEGE